jgi:hypothetical protein
MYRSISFPPEQDGFIHSNIPALSTVNNAQWHSAYLFFFAELKLEVQAEVRVQVLILD